MLTELEMDAEVGEEEKGEIGAEKDVAKKLVKSLPRRKRRDGQGNRGADERNGGERKPQRQAKLNASQTWLTEATTRENIPSKTVRPTGYLLRANE